MFHVDTLDLYSARARAVFVKSAADEIGVSEEVVKRDLGKVLVSCESLADQAIAAAQAPKVTTVELSLEDRAAALELLRSPDLADRIISDFARAGIVGEATNCLVGYLAAVSRKLERPLAVIVQSTSAAGKSALMEAVLQMVPAEERVKFSAMTGQSLFYMGEADLAGKVLGSRRGGGSRAGQLRLEAPPIGGRALDRLDRQGQRLGAIGYPHVQGLRAGGDHVDDDGHRRRRGAAEPLRRAERRRGTTQTRAIHQHQRHAQTLGGLHRQP